MPCSQCNNPNHNRRNASCPVNIANRNGTRPPAELRPRPRFVEPTLQIPRDQMIEEYVLLYKNMRPVEQYETGDGVIYKVYHLLQNSQRIPERLFVRQVCNLVTSRRVRGVLINLAVRENGSEIRFLRDVPFPENTHTQLYIFIPQIPGFNMNISGPGNEDIEPNKPNIDKIRQYIHSIHISMENQKQVSDTTDTCTICLDERQSPQFVQLGCGHEYCAGCIRKCMETYKYKLENREVGMSCALCRKTITTFIFSDTDERRAMVEYIDHEICEATP